MLLESQHPKIKEVCKNKFFIYQLKPGRTYWGIDINAGTPVTIRIHIAKKMRVSIVNKKRQTELR
jgi:hypothetical protein